MTPVEIAYFKHFLFDRGIQAIYISMYRKNRIKGNPDGSPANPESLEQFLQEQPNFRVLTHAFYFNPNSNYGYDYWKDISRKWSKYLELQEDNPQNDKVVVLKGSFAILRQNWDRPQYWKVETMEATYARMHMEPPLKDVDLEKALSIPHSAYIKEEKPEHKFKVGDTIKGTISGEVLTINSVNDTFYRTSDGGIIDFDKEEYWDKLEGVAVEEIEDAPFEENDIKDFSGVPEADANKSESESLLEGFSLVDTSRAYSGKKMPSNVISVNRRNGGYRITFSAKQTQRLQKDGYKYVKLLTKKETEEIALVFNNQSGCNAGIKKSKSNETRNAVVNSKDIVEHICDFYGIGKDLDYFTMEITATIQHNLNLIYKLKRL